MTSQSRATLKAAFEQGDSPQSTDYVDVLDSFLAFADTTVQTLSSDLVVPNLIANSAVSAQEVRTSVVQGVAWKFVSAVVTVLTTAQTSAIRTNTAQQGAHGVFGLMSVTINGSTYGLPLFHRGTYL